MAILIANKGLNGRLKISGNSTGGFKARYVPFVDADVQAFFNRVTAAGGSLTATEQSAITTLVASLKSTGVWVKMSALYPMVGASAAACAQNLKSSSFTGTFSGGWTFTSNGATPNGTNAYMDTNLIPSTHSSLNNTHLSYYSRTQVTGTNGVDIGVTNGAGVNELYLAYNAFGGTYIGIYSSAINLTALPTTTKMFIASRLSSTEVKAYYAGSAYQTVASNSQALTSLSIYLAALHATSTTYYSNRQCAFASIGEGLSDTNASDFYTAVQAFQTTLSRQV